MSLFGKKEAETPQNKVSQAPKIQSSAALLSKEGRANQNSAQLAMEEALLSVNDTKFSDLYITPDKTCYIMSGLSESGLRVARCTDLQEFINAVKEKYDGEYSSYSLNYKGRVYRIERSIASEGEQFCARKMPTSIPSIEKLGFPPSVCKYLMSLANRTGLILFAGATGAGKSTSIAALLKKYLEMEGGYAFTIEDPIEMPLDGVYKTRNGDLGLCKQTIPPQGVWEDGLKSALRSMPKYIYLGEIRSGAAAVELLRASTSGHLVFSTVHANNVVDAIQALAKYASTGGISEDLAYDQIGNSLLACIHQKLEGFPRHLTIETLFANPDTNGVCSVRAAIRSGSLNVASQMEAQKNRLERGMPLWS